MSGAISPLRLRLHGTDWDFTFYLYLFTLHKVTTGNWQGLSNQRVSVQSDFLLVTIR